MSLNIILSFTVTVTLLFASLKIFPSLGLLDFPERYGLARRRLPYPVGILAVLTFIGFFLAMEPLHAQSMGLLLSIVTLATFSFIDDLAPLPFSLRLLVQGAIGVLIFLTGTRIFSLTNPLELWTGVPVLRLDLLTIPSTVFSNPSIVGLVFTVLWLGLTMNALNWLDGIPGQVTLLTTIGCLTIGFLALSSRVDQPELARIAFMVSGIAFACFLFDVPPPSVLIGDTGAMFFGLLLGVLTIYAGGKVATAFLVLGVPLMDTFFVIVRRIAKGASPFRGSAANEHLHHRLLACGWSPRHVILLTALLGGSFGVAALFLSTTGKFTAAMLLFCVMLGLSIYSKPRSKTLLSPHL